MYEEANRSLRSSFQPDKEHRLMLLEAWRDFETENGDEKSLRAVQDLMPRRVKKRRRVDEDGQEQGVGVGAVGAWEEYFDYIFPEDEGDKPMLKLLAKAKMWKKQQQVPTGTGEGEEPTASEQPMEGTVTEEEVKKEDEETVATATAENPDADDEDIRNESSSSDDDDDEEEEEGNGDKKQDE